MKPSNMIDVCSWQTSTCALSKQFLFFPWMTVLTRDGWMYVIHWLYFWEVSYTAKWGFNSLVVVQKTVPRPWRPVLHVFLYNYLFSLSVLSILFYVSFCEVFLLVLLVVESFGIARYTLCFRIIYSLLSISIPCPVLPIPEEQCMHVSQ